jgi:hypothetical protein
MKNTKYMLFTLLVIFTLTSCEEVIEIDLNTANPVLVVEAKLYKDSLATVLLTKTANYFSMETPEAVEDATITIIANGDVSEELLNLGNGIYSGKIMRGTEGINYDIEILWEDEEYKGKAFLPKQAEIVSLEIVEFQPPVPQAPVFHQAEITFLDDPETENFYLIRYVLNGFPLSESYFTFPDISFSDTIQLANPRLSFEYGDLVEVQVFSIDEPLSVFYSQLSQALGGGMAMSSTPYNPTSNIEGAMGYFAAWSYVSDTVRVD